MKTFLRKCWQHRDAMFVLRYDTTDLAFTPNGPRTISKLEKKGYFRA